MASTISSHSRQRQDYPDPPPPNWPDWAPTPEPPTWTDWPHKTTSRALPHLPALPDNIPNLESILPALNELAPSLVPELESALHAALLNLMPTLQMEGSCYKLCF